MGFFSDLGKKIGGGFLWETVDDKLLGGDARDAARRAAELQAGSATDAIGFQRETRDLAREDLQPFRQFGADQINPLLEMLTPQGQADFVNTNPLFEAALDSVNRATMNAQAARGKLGSGGTLQALQNNFLSTAMPFIGQQQNALFNAVNLGQSSASGQANTALNTGNFIADTMLQRGNALAAGRVGAQAARQEALNNLMSMGSQAMGGMMGGGFSDARLKENLNEVDRDQYGGVYEFNYIGSDLVYVGRLAQELEQVRPDAVSMHKSGYLMVSKEFAPKVKEWQH